jgi:hypothetical protein
MATLPRMAFVFALLATQQACMTAKLLEAAREDPKPARPARAPIEHQPVAYTAAERQGSWLALQYDTIADADGVVRTGSPANFNVHLAQLSWQPMGTAPRDANCFFWGDIPKAAGAPWSANVPLVQRPSNDIQEVIAIHKQQAAGLPLLSIQTRGLDTWIVCGTADGISYAQAPTPPPAERGDAGDRGDGGGGTAKVVKTILLLPFALAVDVLGVAMCTLSFISGRSCNFGR